MPSIVLGPKGATTTWRTLPEEYDKKLHRIVHPIIWTRSFWHGLKTFCKITYKENFSSKKPVSAIHELEQATKSTVGQKIAKFSVDHNLAKRQSTGVSAAEQEPSGAASSIFTIDHSTILKTHRGIAKAVTPGSALKRGTEAFQAKFAALQVQAWTETPRGACHVEGFVDCLGLRGTIRYHVVATYHVPTDKLVGKATVVRASYFPNYAELERLENMTTEELAEARDLRIKQLTKREQQLKKALKDMKDDFEKDP